ncbi:MAG: hypothetical protein AB1420_15995 [Bacillota bacterium]
MSYIVEEKYYTMDKDGKMQKVIIEKSLKCEVCGKPTKSHKTKLGYLCHICYLKLKERGEESIIEP